MVINGDLQLSACCQVLNCFWLLINLLKFLILVLFSLFIKLCHARLPFSVNETYFSFNRNGSHLLRKLIYHLFNRETSANSGRQSTWSVKDMVHRMKNANCGRLYQYQNLLPVPYWTLLWAIYVGRLCFPDIRLYHVIRFCPVNMNSYVMQQLWAGALEA